MRINYLNNSGFAFSEGGELIIIDCFDFSPRNGSLADGVIDADTLLAHDKVSVLISHGHGDHFNKKIFSWLDIREDIKYVLSDDISINNTKTEITFIREGQSVSVNGIDILAHGSTDLGVSFDIVWHSKRLFHAGDFNDWHWRDEGDEEWTRDQEVNFTRILHSIACDPKIDIAVFPVDSRMGTEYYRGALRFCEALKPNVFIPMHFGKAFNPPEKFVREIAEYTALCSVGPRGWSAEL